LDLARGSRGEALKALTAAARDRPGDEEAQYYAGLALAESGIPSDRETAIQQLQFAVQADPRRSRAAVALGRLLEEKPSRREQAADLYRQVLQIAPSSAEAEEGLSRVQASLSQPDEAVYHQARSRQLRD